MNKTKKLLSVLLAVVMALSCMSVMASAAKTNYRTVDELEALDAYSPYGQVTRLSTEERMSITLDFLDNVLGKANIAPMNIDITIATLNINLQSVNGVCSTLDSVKSALSSGLSGFLVGILGGLVGVIGDLDLDSWTSGMTRENQAQLTIIRTLVQVLADNKSIVGDIVSTGEIDLGSIIGGLVDLSSIEDLLGDIPGLIKGLVWGLFERWDDTLTEVKAYDTSSKGNGGVESTLNTFVKSLFSNNMSITTVKYDANGNMTSEHTGMPIYTAAPGTPSDNSPRCYYQITGTTPGSVMTVYHIVDEAEAKTLATTPDKVNGSPAAYTYFKEAQTYVMAQEVEGSDTYVWKATDDFGNTWSMKWYNDDSQLLPGISGDDIDLTTMSASQLLYKFIPVVFEQMAPVVLNGSVKKILAEFFGAKFTRIGVAGPDGDDAIKALGSDAIFAGEQGEYLWEWSDYYVADDGTHYYRYLDDLYVADLSNTNNYFDIINWNYEITGEFMEEFVNKADANDSSKRILTHANDFLVRVANEVLLPSVTTIDSYVDENGDQFTATWTRPTLDSGNENLVKNIKAVAQAIIGLAPQHIFGSNYATNERCYFDLMMSSDNDTVLVGIAATLVDALMPSMTLPGKSDIISSGAKVGAILAAVVREFAAYLAPEYNFDALIYTDFGEEDGVKNFVSGKDSDYWFDVILTMGINVGFEYLRAFADMGEDSDEWNAFVAYSGYAPDGKTYTAMTTDELNAHWEGMLDYIIDWALTINKEWTWKMANLVNTTGLTIDLTTAQDPFVKLETILGAILPVSEILNVEPTNGEAKFEHWLRDDLILGIVDLEWDHLINTITISGSHFRTANVLDQLADLLKGIVNSLFAKVGGGSYALLPTSMTDLDSLANQSNLGDLVEGLLGALPTAAADGNGSKGGLLDTALPIVGMFLGWKTDAQKIADPQIWTSFRDGNDYAYQWKDGGFTAGSTIDSTYIKILNNSAGMLETHRNSSVEDHAYDIEITSVTSDATTNDLKFTYDNIVSPYETVDIAVSGTYQGDEAVTVTIGYKYVGKDGEAIGGVQYTSVSFLISNLYEDANIDGRKDGDDDEEYAGINQYKRYQFTEDIYDTIANFKPMIFATSSTTGSTSARDFKYISPSGATVDCDGNVTAGTGSVVSGLAANYFEIHTTQAESGWPDTKPKEGSIEGYIYKVKSGVTAETFSEENSEANNLYGHYDMGSVAVKYDNAEKTWEIDFIYYNSYGIYDIYTENKDNGYNANQGVDADIYNEYNEAWKLIVYGATYPMMTSANGNSSVDYVATIQPYIPAAIERFEAAKEAYEQALAEAQASGAADASLPAYIQTMTEEIENDFIDGKEINFQDYSFYEYFNYNDVKVAAENLYRTYLVPEIMDTYYILNSGIREAELDNVIAAESNPFIAAGITASRLENKQEDIDASIAAREAWVAPITTKLVADDFTGRLEYYKQFLEVNKEPLSYNDKAAHLYFLEKEIAFVEAQGLNSADYESVSWERYAEALAEAKAVAAGSDEFSAFNSRIYDVKYNLMVAYKQLLLKDDSLIEAGGTADLETNINTANEIFASLEAGDGVWTLAADYEGEADDAYAALISALGYYYVGEDGNTWNLYADSALEYADNDRPNNQGNQTKVNVANAALEAAIANFESAAPAEPNTGVGNENAPFEAIVDGTNVNPDGTFIATIYGFDTLGWNDAFEVDGTIIEFFTSTYGDDYVEVVVGDAGVETTGTIINILDEEGNVIETYTYVYFGDVDMDGMVGASDAVYCEYYETYYEGIDTYEQFMAADLDGDAFPGAGDAVYMEYYETYYEGMPLQVDIATAIVDNGLVFEMI